MNLFSDARLKKFSYDGIKAFKENMRKRIQSQLFWFLRYKYNNNDNNNNKSTLPVLKIVWASSLYRSSIKKYIFPNINFSSAIHGTI